MRIIEGFKLRNIAGETVVSGESIAQIDFRSLIVLNESAAYLWSNICDKEFDVPMLAKLLTKEYEVEMERAMVDAQTVAQSWIDAKIVTE